MKIALVHKRLELRGGTERVFYRTAEGLRDRGHEIHLFCGAFIITPPPGVFIHRVPHIPFPRTARFLSFAVIAPRIIDRYHCDVVMSFSRITRQHIFRSGGGPHRAFLEKMMQQSTFARRLWYRLSMYHRSVLAVERRQVSAGGSQRIITVSQEGRREMMASYDLPEEKVTVIYNGVDQERFHPQRRLVEGRKVRDELGIPQESPVVLFVGTGFVRKGLDRVLPLWRLPEFGAVYLLVVGDDRKLAQYRAQWKDFPILLVGPQKAVENYYAAADLLVLPSTQEAFGNVVLEALASGLPVITVPEVGATEKLRGALRDGMLVDRNDPEEIKRKILRLIDKERWPTLSQAARVAAEQYSWDSYFLNLEAHLSNVANGR